MEVDQKSGLQRRLIAGGLEMILPNRIWLFQMALCVVFIKRCEDTILTQSITGLSIKFLLNYYIQLR
jgi:hypothetical protein